MLHDFSVVLFFNPLTASYLDSCLFLAAAPGRYKYIRNTYATLPMYVNAAAFLLFIILFSNLCHILQNNKAGKFLLSN